MIKRYLNLTCLILILGVFLCPNLLGEAFAQEVKKILSLEAYDMLNTVPDTYLIDVRTRAEYQFVGHPPMAYLFPYMFATNTLIKADDSYMYQFSEKNKDFLEEIEDY